MTAAAPCLAAAPDPTAVASAAGPLPRWWSELVADVGDWFPGGVTGLFLLLLALAGAAAFALLWRPRRRDAASAAKAPAPPEVGEGDEADGEDDVPELPPDQLRSLADEHAAGGRHAEAVRERLRAMVRELVERGVIEHRPGWTVTELTAAAGAALPAARRALTEAAGIFSDIWYGRAPAFAAHDARMRTLESEVRAACGARSRRDGHAMAVAEPAHASQEAGT